MFTSFSSSVLSFFTALKINNSKEWFEAHKPDYETDVFEPSKAFIVSLGERLALIAPGIEAIPKVNKSLFRLNRDVRFSSDKSPYKTHLGMLFWEGPRKRMENPGVYVHIEPGESFIACGLHQFPNEVLDLYRNAVLTKRVAKNLDSILKALSNEFEIKGETYKHVPRGMDKLYAFSELTKYKGIFVMKKLSDKDVCSAKLPEIVSEMFAKTLPLHQWFVSEVVSVK